MSIFDFFTGTKRPKPGTQPIDSDALGTAIMAINRDTAPFQITRSEDGKCDFIAEWRIVDATWYQVFAKAGLKKVFRIKMRMDETTKEVRNINEDFTVTWTAGVPTLAIAVSGFRGQKSEVSGGLGYAFTEKGQYGEVYNYRFNSGELKKPLQKVVTEAGWTWRGVALGKL